MTARMVTTSVMISTELGGRSTVLTTRIVYPSFFPVLVTSLVTSAATLADGRSTVYTIPATFSELPRALFSDSPSTATSTAAVGNTTSHPQAPTSPGPATTQSMAWVAGPIVGGVVAIVVVVLLSWRWWCKRRQSTHSDGAAQETIRNEGDKFEKPELPASLLGGGHPIQELEAGGGSYHHEGAALYEVNAEQGSGRLSQDVARVAEI
ncbi:hypothetical protein PG984_011909 [Apiospora sp. TS-2023a]